jgi:Zn-finger nucleic acid-binding protein
MNCPICNVTLLLAEKQGVDIDYCPQCRGLWLDKGKFEKIIDKISSSSSPGHGDYISDSHHYDKHTDHHDQYGNRRKKGLFDFFD